MVAGQAAGITGNKMSGTMVRGVVYFALVFGAGFLLGTVRVLAIEPRIGGRWAELVETPLMLAAIFLSAHFVVRRFPAIRRRSYLVSGGMALLLLIIAELFVVLGIRGISVGRYVAERDPLTGSVYIVMLVIFAAMPWLVSGGIERRHGS